MNNYDMMSPTEILSKIESGELTIAPRVVDGKLVSMNLIPGKPSNRVISPKQDDIDSVHFRQHVPKFEFDEIPDEEVLTATEITMQNISRMNRNRNMYDVEAMFRIMEEMCTTRQDCDFYIPQKVITPKFNHDSNKAIEAVKKIIENGGKCISQPDTECMCMNFITTGKCECGVYENMDVSTYKYHPDYVPGMYTFDDEEDE